MHHRLEIRGIAVFLFLIIAARDVRSRDNDGDRAFQWIEPASCRHSKNGYFHTDTFECKMCPNDSVSDDSGYECVCDGNSTAAAIADDGNPVCALCGAGKIRTIDGRDCISCSDREKSCVCSANEIIIERSGNGTLLDKRQCLPCPRNTYASTDGTRCLPCLDVWSRDDRDDWNIDDPAHEALRRFCTPGDSPKNWPDLQSTYTVEFKSQKISVDSYYLRRELKFTFYSCESGVRKACAQLANMCSLTIFSANSVPCELFKRKNRPSTMSSSRVFYREEEARAALNRRSIEQRYSLDRSDPNNTLRLVVARFGLRGRFNDIAEPNLPCPFFNNLPFGVNLSKRCKIPAVELTNAKMMFLVPYLSHGEKINHVKRVLHPLPVFVKNINEYVSQDDFSRWQLTGRFFNVDTITGYGAISNSKNASFRRAPELQVLRYVKSLSLVVKLQERSKRGKIFPPLLVLEYEELTSREILENVEVTIDYRVTYSLSDDGTNSAIEVSIGVFTGLAVIFSAFQAWSYSRRNCKNVASIATFSWFVVHCLGTVGNVLLGVCSCSCAYTFLFYKGQKVVHILLPDLDNEWIIGICTMIGFVLKAIEITSLLYQQRRMDIFFIDWEQPRTNVDRVLPADKLEMGRLSLGRCTKIAAKASSRASHNDERKAVAPTASEIISARKKRSTSPSRSASRASTTSSRESVANEIDRRTSIIAKVPATVRPHDAEDFPIDERNVDDRNCSVSIWRTCVIANEWLRIGTTRKINILLQVTVTFFILEIAGGKNWSKAIPEWSLESEKTLWIDESFTLKYAVGILVYVAVHSVQWWFSVFIWQRYVKNQLQEFVDLCSIANISVFLLSHDYYGYYIHGRSVHGFADADLLTLIKDLQREEQNLCAHRGLIPGTTEQTFVVSVSRTFRAFYNGLVDSEYSRNGKFLRRNLSNVPTDWDERWRTHLRLREFFTRFLDHCYKNVDYEVKERHCLEKMCDFEVTEVDEKSIFYIDNNYSFDQTIFHGNEWSLATFEMNAFLLVLVLGGNYTLAAIVALLVAKSVSAMAKFNGKRLLARKTFIDERFLISQ